MKPKDYSKYLGLVKQSMNNTIAVVIPTYKELDNVSLVVQKIMYAVPECIIILVDDSPLLESEKLKKMIQSRRNVVLIQRGKKLGRGSAVLEGFRQSMKDNAIRYVFEMDSDLAHDPDEMKKFLEKNKNEQYDLIIGSRYLSGGKTVAMPRDRIILSKIINTFLNIWLGMKLTDYTGGFRLYSRRAVELLLQSKLKSTGFITLSEMAYTLHRNGMRIGEVPISVYGRQTGKSTVNTRLLLSSLLFVIKMRLQKRDI